MCMASLSPEKQLMLDAVAIYGAREDTRLINADLERLEAQAWDEGLTPPSDVTIVSPTTSRVRLEGLEMIRSLARWVRPRGMQLFMRIDSTNRYYADLMYNHYGRSRLMLTLDVPLAIRLRDLCHGERLDLRLSTRVPAGIDVDDLAGAFRLCRFVDFRHNFEDPTVVGVRTFSRPVSETLAALKSLELVIRAEARRREIDAVVYLRAPLTAAEEVSLHAHCRANGYTAVPGNPNESSALVQFGRTTFREDLQEIWISSNSARSDEVQIQVSPAPVHDTIPNESPLVRRQHERGG